VPLTSALRTRRREPELMDDPAIDAAEHRRALAGLARINRFSGSVRVLWPPIRQLARKAGRPIRVLDLATGAGDVPVSLWVKASRARLRLEIAGCDISATAVETAKSRAAAVGARVEFFTHDVLKLPLPDGFDVVTCSLFLHHLDGPDAVHLLREMGRAAGKLVLVNDLARSPVNYLLVRFACRLLSRSPVVRFDGPASVRAAFTPKEVRSVADEAGLSGAKLVPKFPCRFLLAWRKPG
jgi:2-polyprenyl-3-methyl-5-hydroxy-6-metoxy-1,4-benzoquinol methylase